MNKAGSLEFTILPSHRLYDSLEKMKTKVFQDYQLLFFGRVLNDTTDFYRQRKVYCEGCLSYLVDSIFEPSKGKRTVEEQLKKIIDCHNGQVEADKKFTIGTITIDEKASSDDFGEDSYRET